MNANYACNSPEHAIARRQFFGSVAALGAGACVGGLGVFANPAIAAQLRSDQKRIVVFNMAGGLSQLESWDPKPGTATGGPFRAIPTSVPGIHISELLPDTAKQMHHLCLVRGVNTSEDDHGKGQYLMLTGRRQNPASEYPHIGAVAAKALMPADSRAAGLHTDYARRRRRAWATTRPISAPSTQAFNWATATRRRIRRCPRISRPRPRRRGRISAAISMNSS